MNAQQPRNTQNSKKFWIMLSIVSIVLIVVVFLVWLFVHLGIFQALNPGTSISVILAAIGIFITAVGVFFTMLQYRLSRQADKTVPTPTSVVPSVPSAPEPPDTKTTQVLDAEQEPSSGPLPPFWNVPYLRNPFFTDREEILNSLHETLQTGKEGTEMLP